MQVALQGVAQEVLWTPTQTTESQEHADRQHQTPTGQIWGPKHGQMGTWQLPWAGPHSHQDRVTGGCYYRRVSAHSPQADPEGGSEGHSGKLG